MRSLLLLTLLAAAPALAHDTFHGWSKDGTWLVIESKGDNDIVELHFCATDASVKPSWPKELDELEKEEGRLTCVSFLDPNKAPYQWKSKLVLPPSTMGSGKLRVLPELALDGETPGFVVEAGDKRQNCFVSGIKEDSKLQKVWWHPGGRFVAAQVDRTFAHCALTVKAAAAPKGGKRR